MRSITMVRRVPIGIGLGLLRLDDGRRPRGARSPSSSSWLWRNPTRSVDNEADAAPRAVSSSSLLAALLVACSHAVASQPVRRGPTSTAEPTRDGLLHRRQPPTARRQRQMPIADEPPPLALERVAVRPRRTDQHRHERPMGRCSSTSRTAACWSSIPRAGETSVVARPHRPRPRRRRAGPAGAGAPSRLAGGSAGIRPLHRLATATRSSSEFTGTRTCDGRRASTPARERVLLQPGAAVREPQRRPARLRAGRLPVHGPRRRRLAAATRTATARTGPTLLGKILRLDVDAQRRAVRASRPTTRSPMAPTARPRSTCSACATRGASASTARPGCSGSPTSGRTPTRRSTASTRSPMPAPTSAGT